MTTHSSQPTILFVEDDELIREVTTETLKDAGYKVVAVIDGQSALEALRIVTPDLILSDVRMPRCTGFELLEQVRKLPAFRQTPFIFMSAKAETADRRHGMSLGADDYLSKPFAVEDLLNAVETRLKRAAMFKDAIKQHQNFLVRVLPHELRTPLNSVLGYAGLMIEIGQAGETLSVEELIDIGENVQISGQRLLQIAEDFSLWSWLEAQAQAARGGMEVSRKPFSLSMSLLESWIHAIAEQHDRKLDIVLEAQSASVTAPSEGLMRAIQHLVDNALKFSLAKTPVSILGIVRGKNYELTFRDQGRGMSNEEIESIGLITQFQREQFEQQGLGLGLAIVCNFARLAGTELSVIRNPSEPGLTVRLVLLLAES
jgi:two-component system, sensor histidine kinase and response regulator